MSTKDTLENMARNTWLAGLGSIDSSKEALGKSIDAAQEKSNNLYTELLSRGEVMQSKFNHKKDEIQAKGKRFLGMASKETQDERLAKLNATVDQLTVAIATLIEKRKAEAAIKAPKKASPKTASKAASTSTAKRVPKVTANAKSKAGSTSKPPVTTKEVAKPATEAAKKAD